MAATFTAGTGKTYATVQGLIDAMPGDGSGQGAQTGEIYETVAGKYPENPDSVTGFTNQDATNYMHFKGMTPHKGISGAGIIIEGQQPGGNLELFRIAAWTRMDDLEITQDATNSGWTMAIRGNGAHLLQRLLVRDIDSGDRAFGLYNNVSATNKFIYNTMFQNLTGGNTASAIFFKLNAAAGRIFNCTVHNVDGYGFRFEHGLTNVTNCVFGTTGNRSLSVVVGFTPVVNYCTSADTYADDFGGTGNDANKSVATWMKFVNATSGSEDLHLQSDSSLIGTADDLSGTFTDDIDIETRALPWDRGADQKGAIAGGGGFGNGIMNGVGRGIYRGVA